MSEKNCRCVRIGSHHVSFKQQCMFSLGFETYFLIQSELASSMQTLSPKARSIRQNDQRTQAHRPQQTSNAPCKAHYRTAAQPSGAGCRKHACTMHAFHPRSSVEPRHNTEGSGRRKARLGIREQKSQEVQHKNFELRFNLASSVSGLENPASVNQVSFFAGKQRGMHIHLNAKLLYQFPSWKHPCVFSVH